MKILIITQKVDKDDTVLGFFHGWIKEFATKYEHVYVVCLEKGRFDLPDNISVLSLGKESGQSKLKYVYSFYKYIWQLRHRYDVVFVHMNEEYALLGGLYWKILGKKVVFWRNHPEGGIKTRIAVWVSDKVFCTSTFSFTADYKKTKIMPVGIDTQVFKRNLSVQKIPNSILVFGRISPIKKIEVFIDACHILQSRGLNFKATIVGDVLPAYEDYYLKLRQKSLLLGDKIKFKAGIPNPEASNLYNQFEIYVNMTPSGSFDKTILEAAAAGTISICSNRSLLSLLGKDFVFKENSAASLAEKIQRVLCMDEESKKNLAKEARVSVVREHELSQLVSRFYLESVDLVK